MEEIFKSSVVTIKFDREHSLAYIKWDGTVTLETYKAPYLFLLNEFKPKVLGLISDIRKQGVVGPEMRNWMQNEASPKAKARGVKYFYIVSDANAFKQYYLNTILKLLKDDGSQIERRIFQNFNKCESAMLASITEYKSKSLAS